MHGKEMMTIIRSIQREDGKYDITHQVVHRRSSDLENWEQQVLEVSDIAESEEEGVKKTSNEILMYLYAVRGDLFNLPEAPDDTSQ